MSLIANIYKKYRSFGGLSLLATYIRLGLGGCALKCLLQVLSGRMKLHDASMAMARAAMPKLNEEFSKVRDSLISNVSEIPEGSVCENDGPIWWCWLQGKDNAPESVNMAYQSLVSALRKYGIDKEMKLIDISNIKEYVEIPDFIQKKYEKGVISMAHYADVLRLALLNRYGGTWIDSTIYATGDFSPYINKPLFMFQNMKKGYEDRFLGISNWWISARKGHPALVLLQEMLFEYWRHYDCVLNYFMFHQFFGLIVEARPHWWKEMPRHNNIYPLYLEHRIAKDDALDKAWMIELKKRTPIHKLSYRLGMESIKKWLE